MIATDPLSLLFVGCFLIGMAYLLLIALLGMGHGQGHGVGHHVDTAHHLHTGGHSHLHHHVGEPAFSLFTILNPTSVVLFLLGFGFFGYVLHNTTSLAFPITIALAAISGCIIAALLLTLLSRLFGDSEAETIQDVSDRTGLLGKVCTTIQENNIGEILYVSPGGMRKSIPARSVDGRRLERDQEVVVVNYQRGIAEVDTWDHIVNQEPAETSGPSDMHNQAALRALLEETNATDSAYVTKKERQKE